MVGAGDSLDGAGDHFDGAGDHLVASVAEVLLRVSDVLDLYNEGTEGHVEMLVLDHSDRGMATRSGDKSLRSQKLCFQASKLKN